ncbi:tetraspanin-7 isoform X3 [Leptinotarsa decemlineata]|uniref:tetraspanin-7 isoform X3 n=1 Tax=Leptinotarsa decemlineata TaxID=7539 RepID=UPI003D30CC1C
MVMILNLIGICLLSLGITYKINLEEFSYAVPKDYQNIVLIPVLTIPMGTLLIVIAIFGCYGCLAEKFNFVALYTTVLFVLFAVQLTVGISSFYQLGDMGVFRGKLNLTLEVVFQNYNYHFENKAVVDLIQHRLKCCGFNGPDNWDVVPKSCHVTDSQDIFEQPCPPLVSDYIDDSMNILGISVIVLSIPETSSIWGSQDKVLSVNIPRSLAVSESWMLLSFTVFHNVKLKCTVLLSFSFS